MKLRCTAKGHREEDAIWNESTSGLLWTFLVEHDGPFLKLSDAPLPCPTCGRPR